MSLSCLGSKRREFVSTDSQAEDNRIPVTIVTGFLGSGKSTLLNNFLRQISSKNYALIVNEYGEIGVDGDLIETGTEELIELSSGCICCVVRGDLITGMRDLIKRESELDGIIIETTGLANPSPVIQTLLVDQVISIQCRLDTVICMIDAINILSQIENFKDVTDQIAFADHLIINKIKEMSHNLAKIEEKILKINPFARVTKTNHGELQISQALNQRGFELERIDAELLEAEIEEHNHEEHSRHNHIEEAEITSLSLVSENSFDEQKLEDWLQDVLSKWGSSILRTKGVLSIAGREKKLIVQAVNMMLEGDFRGDWKSSNRLSKLVFIGRNLNIPKLKAGFKSCEIAKSSSDH